jgi:hypothetical protein
LTDFLSALGLFHQPFPPVPLSLLPNRQNTLRRHNYIGLIHALLLELAKQNKLAPQIEAAKERMKVKVAEAKAKGGGAGDAMEED